jgi:hypothetical protein
MHVREIPKQIFDELAVGRSVGTHDFHDLVRQAGPSRSLDLVNYGPIVATCDMDNGVWLRLGDQKASTDLEVIISDDAPIDTSTLASDLFETRRRLARLSAGSFSEYMSTSIKQGIHMDFSLESLSLGYPITQREVQSAKVIYAIPIIGEVARRSFELLSSGAYETSRFDREEIDLRALDAET